MGRIGFYTQLSDFTTDHAGTAEWCIAEKNGEKFFIKKFQSPTYPSKEIGLSEAKYEARVKRFHETIQMRMAMYERLRRADTSKTLVVPVDVINYQYHICAVSEYVSANLQAEDVHRLSEWQRLTLMRTLTMALSKVHAEGIVHSDMKPDNLLIGQSESGYCNLHLIDFDSSFLVSAPPKNVDDLHGDMAYFPPEVYKAFMGEDVRLDQRMDVFALGLIYHFLWSGKLPEKPDNQTVGEYLLDSGELSLDDSLPPMLHQLITWMLAPNPEARISCHDACNVLDVQIKDFPKRLVRLITAKQSFQNKEQTEKAAQQARETSRFSSSTSEHETRGFDDKKRKAVIKVLYYDDKDRLLSYRTISTEYNTLLVVEADHIEGYRCISSLRKEYSVNSSGYIRPIGGHKKNKTYKKPIVKFYYEPVRRGIGTSFLLLATIIILIVATIGWFSIQSKNAISEYDQGNWTKAKQLMDGIPLFSVVYKEAYDNTIKNLSTSVVNSDGTGIINIDSYSDTEQNRELRFGVTEKTTATLMKKPAPTPTKKPTPKPTKIPTPTPTKKPTPVPTKKPTPTPTKKPTPTPPPTKKPYGIGDLIRFGNYEQDGNLQNGKESIEWTVIAIKDRAALLLSRYGLDSIPYNYKMTSTTWADCSLRDWLNNDFMYAAFNNLEEEQIQTTDVIAEPNPYYPKVSYGESTRDKVFLLSVNELERYLPYETQRFCLPTQYALDRGAHENSKTGRCRWWLRSPGENSKHAANVFTSGEYWDDYFAVNASGLTVRPAIWIIF